MTQATAVLLSVVPLILSISCKDPARVPEKALERPEDALTPILKHLVRLPGSEAYQKGEAMLLEMGTNAVPFLLTEIDEIGELLVSEDLNHNVAGGNRRGALYRALRVLGTNMEPFAEDFIGRLYTGANPADAGYALAQMSDPYASELIAALGHESALVRAASASCMTILRDDSTLGAEAFGPLLALLTDEFVDARLNAAAALGYLKIQPETVLPALLERLEDDQEDIRVRLKASMSMVRIGISDSPAYRAALARVAEAEGDSLLGKHIRRMLSAMSKENESANE